MLTSELDYALPPELIAQEPVEPRDASRLMVLQRGSGTLQHHHFHQLPHLLRPDDLLIFNDTRVLHARLRGFKEGSGGRVEALLLREVETNAWEALLKPSARLKPGSLLRFVAPGTQGEGPGWVPAQVVERLGAGWLVRFLVPEEDSDDALKFADVRAILPILGEVPLPPYIRAVLRDAERYQTIYARAGRRENECEDQGQASSAPLDAVKLQAPALDSAAAPTAGLHFTPALLAALDARGLHRAFVTLSVGAGTFRPVQAATLEEHSMHAEEYEVPPATARAIEAQHRRGGRVIAVGTTTTRVLESATDEGGRVQAGPGRTSIFIRPGYRFRCVDALLTNFHLPRSTLLAMIAAFCESGTESAALASEDGSRLTGLQKVRYAYSQAIALRYRFFSFGDAMFIE